MVSSSSSSISFSLFYFSYIFSWKIPSLIFSTFYYTFSREITCLNKHYNTSKLLPLPRSSLHFAYLRKKKPNFFSFSFIIDFLNFFSPLLSLVSSSLSSISFSLSYFPYIFSWKIPSLNFSTFYFTFSREITCLNKHYNTSKQGCS
ncbi:hypothetical protein Pint_35502 [Pistacia integerrima]|uniref:Uncharacterized protein n=1 Tax=Pistacia integerrima TaxID=434235 RepID=A0ACC0Y3E7_9ROSI|nr:hypothetical protein Pint_35502 [Pistacia integerrima]